jgi:hypothetical protein
VTINLLLLLLLLLLFPHRLVALIAAEEPTDIGDATSEGCTQVE